jgi:hypothetical protein
MTTVAPFLIDDLVIVLALGAFLIALCACALEA